MNFGETIVTITAIVLGCSMVLIPVAGLTARYAIKPLLDSWSRTREIPMADERIVMLERRLALAEEQIQLLEKDNHRLLDEVDFRDRLRAPI